MEKKTFISQKPQKISRLILDNGVDISYAAFSRAIKNKDVKVNGKRVNADTAINAGDCVEIFYLPEKVQSYTQVFADDNILIIDKFSGFSSESVFESVKQAYNGARFIHRLDRNTSGIMAFALNGVAEEQLLLGFKERAFDKRYLATVKGVPRPEQATLSAYLIKDKRQSTVKIYDNPVKGSAPIKTGYKLINTDGETSLLEVKLYTGKTHQIRAHLAYIGFPIVGDGKYGDNAFNKKKGAKKQMLCAKYLTLHFKKDSPLYYLEGKTFTSEN